ncbi:MAG: FHA domain-containing protein, partial [Candidatus Spyradocola sp.]
MEVKMVQCPNGHFYNAALHASCPECARSAESTGSFSPTEAPGAGSFSPTEAPGMGGFSPTEAPGTGFSGAVPGAGDPFGYTVIGGPSYGLGQPEPVVGWLVCIEGPMRGLDYRIHAGYNYIGRETGDIHIAGDMQISRQNHAMVAFDSEEQTYFVGPSAGRNLIKVNGKTVLNAVQIHS